MKKTLFILVCIISIQKISLAQIEKKIPGQALSAEDKKKMEDTLQGWKFGGSGSLTLSQAAFVNWAAGGTNSIALLFKGNFYGDYKKGNHLVATRASAEYGIQFLQNNKKFKPSKNADSWEIFGKYGYKVYKPLYVAAYGDLRSQFSKTFTKGIISGENDSVISKGGSPLVFEGAIGLDYVPNSKFSLFFSPVAVKVTFVGDNFLASRNAYGVGPNKTKSEFGAALIATYKQSFWKDKITLSTILRGYKNYLHGVLDPNLGAGFKETNANYAKNIDVDWQTTISFNVNKYLSASIYTQLIWDNDVLTPVKNSNPITSKQQVQFRDIIGINVAYNPNFYKAKGVKARNI